LLKRLSISMPNIHGLHNTGRNSNNANRAGNNSHSGDSDSDEDNQNRQNFFVGGSAHSGQEVLGPPTRENRGSLLANLFDAARNAGAEEISPEEAEANANAGSSHSYQGGAFTLGGHGQPSQSLQKPASTARAAAVQPVVVNFQMWTNGFSIDDGPLRSMEDPQSHQFLQAVSHGQIPQELLDRYPGRKVDFHMVRKGTEYEKPKPKPFAGEGNRLGAVVPNVVQEPGLVMPEAPKLTESESAKLLKDAQEGLKVNTEEPTTRIRIRLPTNQTIVGTFNQSHTIEAVRHFIVSADPSMAYQPFQLMTSYPIAVIEKEEETLKDAGLLSASLTAKFIQ
jgi:UBX domain-containing protein 1